MSKPILFSACLLWLVACQSSDPIVRPGKLYTEEEKAAMSTEEKVQAYNEQVEDKDQLVCRREARTGSHRHLTVCRTLAEIQAEREQAQDDIELIKKHKHVLPPFGDPPVRQQQ